MIDIKGLDKAEVLFVLYNCAITKENDFYARMSDEEASDFISFAYSFSNVDKSKVVISIGSFYNKVLNVNLTGDEFDPTSYNKHNGENMAQIAIDSIRW